MSKLPSLAGRDPRLGRILAWVGTVMVLVSPFLSWAYRAGTLDDVHYTGAPSPLQILTLVVGVLLAWCVVPVALFDRWFNRRDAARALSTGLLVLSVVVLGAIAIELEGLVAVNPGGWLLFAGSLVAMVGTRLEFPGTPGAVSRLRLPSWAEIVLIAVLMLAALFGAAYILGVRDGGTFVSTLVIAATLVGGVVRSATGKLVGRAARHNRRVLVLSAFLVAFLFPFTQNGLDDNMSIAAKSVIFAVTALGLNIVVGFAGLLDLGYIAFLGAGAFVAAMLSNSAFATIGWHPPFVVVMIIAGCVSGLFGLIIGSPTLRVSGDYLAIVTLAFGEIFRITMNNLDGSDGPDLTHGSNGIPAIPDLQIGSFNFGQPHEILGITLGRFANYYLLLLVLLVVVITIVHNMNKSRIGRGWIAIREDEKAAEAMGVNVFGLKLLAFAGGAFLAGVAGAIKAHLDISVTPDSYIFMESSFLLAAVVLGGMGTIGGVILGAVILRMLPEKLRFISDYRLLAFGLLLVIMMRFRPEGLLPSSRRQLEFHDDDEDPDADGIQAPTAVTAQEIA